MTTTPKPPRTSNHRPRRRWRRLLAWSAGGLAGVLVLGAAIGYGVLQHEHGAFDRNMAAVARAGYVERDAVVDGARIHYAESPADGKPALLLVHGQTGDWKAYADVLPDLARDFHVYAVDCFGHGQSAHDPALYSARAHGEKLARFIETTIKEPVVLSGHSSGGVLAAWLAGNARPWVRATLLEDPPLFTTQLPRATTTWNYVDLATACHEFLASGATDFPAYAWEHQRMWKLFGGSAQMFIDEGLRHRARHPDRPIRVWYVPAFDELTRPMETYDPRFGDAFFTGSWDDGFDLEGTLRAIDSPTTLVHTKVAYDTDGVLMAAMGHEEAARARELIRGSRFVKVETGHGFHYEDPKLFVQLVRDLR